MSVPDPVPRKTGLHGVDLFVGGCALLVSVVSLFIAAQSNRTQERMLAASVWPDLDYDTNNMAADLQTHEVSLEVRNLGVGPARIRSFQLFYKGQPMADDAALVRACCAQEAAGLKNWNSRISAINPLVLPAHDSVRFFAIVKNGDNTALWEALNRARNDATVQACYCSVLDQCWMLDSTKPQPEGVASCPVPAGPQYH